MEHHGREEMDSKEESPQVWPDSAEQDQNAAQGVMDVDTKARFPAVLCTENGFQRIKGVNR